MSLLLKKCICSIFYIWVFPDVVDRELFLSFLHDGLWYLGWIWGLSKTDQHTGYWYPVTDLLQSARLLRLSSSHFIPTVIPLAECACIAECLKHC